MSLERPRGEVRVERVGYRYADRAVPALDDVSFTLRPGEVIAVVGASGAGKSTLARLILRGLDPATGRVLLDGHDLRDLTRASLRRHVAVVLQETLLLDGTVRDNITYGRPDATDEQIRAAARQPTRTSSCRVARRVRHPGRRTRATALRRPGPADRHRPGHAVRRPGAAPRRAHGVSRCRQQLTGCWRPLRRLMAGRATLVISHNLLTAELADRVLVLDRGRLVQEGSHEELVARPGPYAALWEMARGAGVAR